MEDLGLLLLLPSFTVVSAPAKSLRNLPGHWDNEDSSWELKQKLIICHPRHWGLLWSRGGMKEGDTAKAGLGLVPFPLLSTSPLLPRGERWWGRGLFPSARPQQKFGGF